MSGNDTKGSEEALNSSIGFFKGLQEKFPKVKLFAYIVAFLSTGGGTVFVWAWEQSQDHIIKVATPKIVHIADSISISHAKNILDSIAEANSLLIRLDDELSAQLMTPRDSLAIIIGEWYRSQKGIYQIGLFGDMNTNKIRYRHVNGEVYRAIFRPEKDYYYYFNDQGKWRQVK